MPHVKTIIEKYVFFKLTEEQADEIVSRGWMEKKYPFQRTERVRYTSGKNTNWLYKRSTVQPEEFWNANELLTGIDDR